MSFLSLSMYSFVMRRTSAGECVHDGAAWGGTSEAIGEVLLDSEKDEENKPETVDCDRCRTRESEGVTQRACPCPNPGIDF